MTTAGRPAARSARVSQISKRRTRVYWTPWHLVQHVPRSGCFAAEVIIIRTKEHGIMSGTEAYRRGLGGEALCRAW